MKVISKIDIDSAAWRWDRTLLQNMLDKWDMRKNPTQISVRKHRQKTPLNFGDALRNNENPAQTPLGNPRARVRAQNHENLSYEDTKNMTQSEKLQWVRSQEKKMEQESRRRRLRDIGE